MSRRFFHAYPTIRVPEKEFLRSTAARTYQDLDQAITDALTTVTPKDIIAWFTHCCYYIPPN